MLQADAALAADVRSCIALLPASAVRLSGSLIPSEACFQSETMGSAEADPPLFECRPGVCRMRSLEVNPTAHLDSMPGRQP